MGYQDSGDPTNPNPFDPNNVCNNVQQNQFFVDGGQWTFQPGVYQILVQTNFIGQTCINGFDYTMTVQ